MANLGRAVTILLVFEREAQAQYEDLSAFHAPSECYGDVERGLRRRSRLVWRRAYHAAGVKNMAQLRRALKRAVPTWDRYNYYRLGLPI